MTSSEILLAAMGSADIHDPIALAGAVNAHLPVDARIKAQTTERWLAGSGIPDRYLPALRSALPALDVAALAIALGEMAAERAGTTPVTT